MPYYIEEITPESAWYGDLQELKDQEVIIVKYSSSHFLVAELIKPTKSCSGKEFTSRGVKLRWEDYPSEECRAGLLAPEDAVFKAIHIITEKQNKQPVTLASKL